MVPFHLRVHDYRDIGSLVFSTARSVNGTAWLPSGSW
jgi:hypothetical protein